MELEDLIFMSRGPGSIQKRFLILLLGYLSFGLCYRPAQRGKVLRQVSKEWERVNEESLRQAIQNLYKNKLIDIQELADGRIKIILENSGRKRALEYKLEDMAIQKPSKWDGKWRIVLFDIPHSKKKAREAIRSHLKHLGFYQYQKSVFVHPFPCDGEIDFLIEFYQLRPYVRQISASSLDNDFYLRKIFKL